MIYTVECNFAGAGSEAGWNDFYSPCRRTRSCPAPWTPRARQSQAAKAMRLLQLANNDKDDSMIKVNVMYPYSEGARFDHAYYRDRHMPLVKARLGDACAYYTVEKGLAGRESGSPPAFVAMCAFICDTAESYEAAIRDHRAEIRADIANYTDIQPVLQFSEVVVERSGAGAQA